MKYLLLVKTILLNSFLVFFCINIYGQSSDVYKLTPQANHNNIEAETYFRLANKYSKKNSSKAWEYLRRGKEYSGTDLYLNAKAIFVEAIILSDTDRNKAEKNFLKVDKLLSSYNSKEAFLLRARAWQNYLQLHTAKHDHKTKLSILTQKVIPLLKAAEDSIYLAESYASIARIFMDHKQYEKATEYYKKALELLRNRDKKGSLKLSVTIGLCQNLLRSKEPQKAKLLLDDIRDFIPPNTQLAAKFGLNEGMYYSQINQYQLALQKFSKAKVLAEKLKKNQLKDAIIYYQKVTLEQMKRYKEASKVASETFNKPPSNPRNKIVRYQNNSEVYFQQKIYDSAYIYLKKFSQLKDSIYVGRLKNEINAIEIKFRSEENQRKITELKISNQKAAFQVSQNRLYMIIFGISTILLAALVILLYMYMQKNKKEHAHREHLNVTTALMQGQEEERKRIARDLHDDLGGTLASAKMRFSGFINENNIASTDESIKRIMEQLDNSSAKIRQIANNMMPEMLLKLGLEAALRDLSNNYTSESLTINLNYLGVSETLAEQDKLNIYRIIQELLTNTVKHANAENVLIQCSQNEHVIFLTFEDDGKGLYSNKTMSSGLGLENIKARVAYMNGEMEIIAGNEYKGTIFNIELNTSNETSNRNS
ncbi:ATP-binding protein [Elizabethkingia anophelis]|uniref:histidine kinase n=1 Tax=Elizabethkingia anophelis TaxID=1117645 RepID=A0AAU8V062_9FLAO|nr:histidine kinase [Elizabethkingia anophelis]AQX02827.1 hypothetical protein BBD32_15850 [Elizabethkingia anophelis]OPB56813.1 hypothetical protein BAY11_12330 [Elizabethkingia anophelis]